MKIISVLYFPFENSLVVRVMRADGYFSAPQKVMTYHISYDSPIVESFFRWYQKLQRLSESKIFNSMKDRQK